MPSSSLSSPRAAWAALVLVATVGLGAAHAPAETFRIEIDYMVDDDHSHRPSQEELQAVIRMFACQGHTLIIELSDAIPHHDVLRRDPQNGAFFSYDGEDASFGSLKDQYFDNAGQAGWHYCIFAHQYEGIDDDGNYFVSGSSGIAEILGDDLLVSLGAFTGEVGTPFDRASTLAHEFGHNLGLTHCGQTDCDDIENNSPVLASIMSYNYQLEGVRSGLLCNDLIPDSEADLFRDLDYSHGRLPSLNEGSLVEAAGMAWRPVDWDCSGTIGGVVSQDLSSDGPTWCGNTGSLQTISDHDEWSNLQDVTRTKSAEWLEKRPEITCITAEEVAALRRANCPNPDLVVESCVSASVYHVLDRGTPGGDGSWFDPLDSVTSAQSQAVPGSAVVLEPGVYDESGGGSLLLTTPARYHSVAGGSLIR
jgi:hypothetical protein